MHGKNKTVALALPLTLLAAGHLAAAEVPDWLAAAALTPGRPVSAKAPAEVLVDEGRWVVDEKGDVTSKLRYALRILTREGRAYAVARAAYSTDCDKVRQLSAWVVDPDGSGRRIEKDRTLDLALGRDDVYSEDRARLINASDEVKVGSVFGFEAEVQQRAFFNQLQWSFQDQLPVRSSRLELVLPPGWTVETHTFNHAAVEAARAGASQVWEMRDLPFLEDEPAAPEFTSLAPRLAVSYAPPAGGSASPLSFGTWEDVARWVGEISDARSEPDQAITAKARELTLGAADDQQRLEAIARFVQGVPYISIQVGLGRFQPRAAADVLRKQYGDCKGKVALMRALLKAVGLSAYPFLVASGDPSFVRREWPSPIQFDHAIVAVPLAGADGLPAAFRHPTLGTLLLFDPTDEHTLLGDLPESEQGGLGLLAGASAGALVRVPVVAPEASRFERETTARLSEDGGLAGRLVESSRGQAAVRERRAWKGRTRQDYVSLIERWLAEGIVGVRAERVDALDGNDGGFRLEVDFAAAHYAQFMQDRLLVFKPALVGRRDSLFLTTPARQHPVVLQGRASRLTTRIVLPAGFTVDELPPAAEVTTPFGSYSMQAKAEGGELVLERRFRSQAVTIPAAEYASVRSFFERIMQAEQAPVVLLKQ